MKGNLFVIACYAPPNILPAEGLLEYLSDVICEGKRTFEDCSILLCGDFNQWPVQELLVEDHPDLTDVVHGLTRGNKSIDRCFCNFGRSIVVSGTLPQ